MPDFFTPRLLSTLTLASLALFTFLLAPAVSAIAHSYSTKDHTIQVGMVVASDSTDSTDNDQFVVKATQSNANAAVGIVTDAGKPDAVVLPDESQAFNSESLVVTDNGQVTAYVSDVNGIPKAGDLLVPSPLAGTLMLASAGTKGVMAVMSSNFPTSTEKHTLKDGRTVNLAAVPVDLDIQAADRPEPSSGLRGFTSRSIGHDVNDLQAIVSVVVIIVTLLIASIITYGAVSNFLTALGRNPLAKNKLRTGLLETIGLALLVILAGAISCWAVLWL